MKLFKPILAAFIVIFAALGVLNIVSFDIVLPTVVICVAFITYYDAKRAAADGNTSQARTLMTTVIFLIALSLFWLFGKFSAFN